MSPAKGLTRHWSEPLAALLSRSDFIRELMIKRYLARRDNPWELLAIALLFFIPGVGMLLHKEEFLLPSFGSRVAKITSWSPTELHVFGWFAVSVTLVLTVLYFYARRAIVRDAQTPPPRFLDT